MELNRDELVQIRDALNLYIGWQVDNKRWTDASKLAETRDRIQEELDKKSAV